MLNRLRKLRELQAVKARSDQAESAERVARYYHNPALFVEECIAWPKGQRLAPYQRDLLDAIPAHHRIAVRGPHGLGKSAIGALLVLWFATTRNAAGVDWKIPTTAGAWRQLEKYLWPEIHKWSRRLRMERLGRGPLSARTELLDLNLKMSHGAAFAIASDDPALIEGVHADAVLYLFDEAKAITPNIFDAAEGAFSGASENSLMEAYAAALSTPGPPHGRFYEICSRKPGLEDWWARHVTVDEAIAAGRISEEWRAQRATQWGEGSALYANRVLGEFHAADEDSIVPLAWVEAAFDRWRAWDEAGRPDAPGPRTVGVDVARSGADCTVLAERDGCVVTHLRRASRQDTMATTGQVAGILRATPGRVAVVDVIGVGGGVVDRLREMSLPVVAFNASESANNSTDRSGELGFVNRRSAAWWGLRELLDPAYGPDLALPPSDQLAGDLTAPTWRVVSGGKIQLESKDDIRKRIGRSTDDGDAVVQAVWSAPDYGAHAWVEYARRLAVTGVDDKPSVPSLAAARDAAYRETTAGRS